MTPTTQRGSNAFVATGLAIALAMFGCDSSSPSRTNGINNAKPDGGGSTPETGGGDTPLGGGGGIQGGGGSAGGGKTSGGGSGGSTASGTVGGYGGALGGSAGTIAPAGGGAGGAVAGIGGAGGQVSSGAGGQVSSGAGGAGGQVATGTGGLVGTGGSTSGQGGGYGRDAGRGGAGGVVDAAIGGGGDAAVRDGSMWAREALWWENDAGIKTCKAAINSTNCMHGGPSICVVAGTYDAYQCSSRGRWGRQPDNCPGLLDDGDMCTGQFLCVYPSYWYCDCSAGMGFRAKCGDIRNTDLLIVREAGGPFCPDDPDAPCAWGASTYCVKPNMVDICGCSGGKIACESKPCPSTVVQGTPCDSTVNARWCQSVYYEICMCYPGGYYSCSEPR